MGTPSPPPLEHRLTSLLTSLLPPRPRARRWPSLAAAFLAGAGAGSALTLAWTAIT